MGKFSGCLLLADIDNTLVEAGVGKIPKRNIEAITYFTEGGGLFSVATGRCLASALPTHIIAGGNTLLLCSNGGTLYDPVADEVAYRENLCEEDKRLFLRLAAEFPDCAAEVQDGADVYLINDCPVAHWHAKYEGVEMLPAGDIGELLKKNWSKGIFLFDDAEEKAKVKRFAESLTPTDAVYVDTAAGDGVHVFFEFHPRLSNKGDGALKLKEIMGARLLCSIGDYDNDIPMLKAADVSACVSESPDTVKSVVDYVTCSCAEGAVADFIYYIEKLNK